MSNATAIESAIGHHQRVPADWMSATGVHSLVAEDPVLIWLRFHGKSHGFQPDASPYEFLDFIAHKGAQFEDKWIQEMAPEAVTICAEGYDVHLSDQVQRTQELIQQGVPVIVQAALWWAPERIYGIPDVLVHTSWLAENMPTLVDSDQPDHYVVFDQKFTSNLDSPRKARDLRSYASQVRLYSYMVGHLQGVMPKRAYLITRDRPLDPLPIEISSILNFPLEEDLVMLRDRYVDIKLNGAKYLPWRDTEVVPNLAHRDDQWHTAKKTIAWEKTPGRDPGVVYQISTKAKEDLARNGFPTLDSLLKVDPSEIPLESCAQLGSVRSSRIRAILRANRSGKPSVPPQVSIPPRREHEFFVDYEFFSNVNVDFERQWPTLDGNEMLFMIGVGWRTELGWSFRAFTAQQEHKIQERRMVKEFLEFLHTRTDGAFTDASRTAIYHWTNAEVWQSFRAADRQKLSDNHPLRRLPWVDLQNSFLDGPIGVPGAWSYQLKAISLGLAEHLPGFDLKWPGDLDQGLRAMVMGWRAYEASDPAESEEIKLIQEYLEADCKALWQNLSWLRSLPV